MRPPSIGIDGTPRLSPGVAPNGKSPRCVAAAAADEARSQMRRAFDALTADGFHPEAELAVTAIDAIDALRMELTR